MSVRWRASLGLGLYIAALLVIAFWPTPVDRPIDGILYHALSVFHRWGGPHWVDYAFVESAANVALFVPLGLLFALSLHPKHWWLPIPFGLVVSCGLELVQLLFLSNRYATWADVAANTTGAALGAVLALLVGWLRAGRRRRRVVPQISADATGMGRAEADRTGSGREAQGVLGGDPGEHGALDPCRVF